MSEDIKGMLEYLEDDLRTGLRPGDYHLKIVEAEGGSWDEEGTNPRLEIQTQVVSGLDADKFGPRHNWSINEFIFEGNDETDAFTTTKEDNVKKLVRQVVFAIHGGRELQLTDDRAYDVNHMKEVARQIKGDEFIASVSDDKNGYPKIRRIYSMEKPPKGFKASTVVSGFSL